MRVDSTEFDIPGDSTGVFQSGIPIVSMHHFMASGWVRPPSLPSSPCLTLLANSPHLSQIHLFAYGSVHTELEQITRVRDAAAFLGGDNVFSRHVFGNGKWLVVHGYSVTYFEEPLKREDLALMVRCAASPLLSKNRADAHGPPTQEHTWYEGYPLSFEDRPHIQERHDPKGKPAKQTFYIVRSFSFSVIPSLHTPRLCFPFLSPSSSSVSFSFPSLFLFFSSIADPLHPLQDGTVRSPPTFPAENRSLTFSFPLSSPLS